MGRVFVFLADGFEEMEALTPVDVLRRADVEVVTVGVGTKWVTGSHNICVQADVVAEHDFTLPADAVAVVLPGGMPGTLHLRESEMVRRCVQMATKNNLFLAAICAAPSVLEMEGILKGRRFTAFPGVVDGSTGAAVEVDGNVITARGAAVALSFSKALLCALTDEETANEVVAKMQP